MFVLSQAMAIAAIKRETSNSEDLFGDGGAADVTHTQVINTDREGRQAKTEMKDDALDMIIGDYKETDDGEIIVYSEEKAGPKVNIDENGLIVVEFAAVSNESKIDKTKSDKRTMIDVNAKKDENNIVLYLAPDDEEQESGPRLSTFDI